MGRLVTATNALSRGSLVRANPVEPKLKPRRDHRRIRHGWRDARRRARADGCSYRHSRTRRTAERYARDARRAGHLPTWILSSNRDVDRWGGATVQPRQLLLRGWKQQVLRCGPDPIPRVRLPADRTRRRDDARLAV